MADAGAEAVWAEADGVAEGVCHTHLRRLRLDLHQQVSVKGHRWPQLFQRYFQDADGLLACRHRLQQCGSQNGAAHCCDDKAVKPKADRLHDIACDRPVFGLLQEAI